MHLYKSWSHFRLITSPLRFESKSAPEAQPVKIMNTFAVFVAVAMLASMVNATPCTDICNAQCEIQKNTCTFAELFGNLCDTVNGVCTQACTAACSCADSCATECGGAYAKCKADDSAAASAGPFPGLNVLSCGINLPICSATCQAKCNFNLLAGVVNALGGGAASSGQSQAAAE